MMNKKELIPKYYKFTHYFRYCNYPHYFILNKYIPNDELLELANADDEDLEENSFLELNFDIEEYERDLDLIVKTYIVQDKVNEYLQLNTFEEKINYVIKLNSTQNLNFKKSLSEEELKKYAAIFENFNEILLKVDGIKLYSDQATEFLQSYMCQTYNLNISEIKIISSKLSIEDKAHETNLAIKDGYRLIINPVFMWKDIVASPYFYMPNDKVLGNLGYSGKTSSSKLLRAWFDYSILAKLGYDVFDYKLCLMKKSGVFDSFAFRKWTDAEKLEAYIEEMQKWRKGKNNFTISEISAVSKTSRNVQTTDLSNTTKIINFLTTGYGELKKISIDEFKDYVNDIESKITAWELPETIDESPLFYLTYKYEDINNVHKQIIEKYHPDAILGSKEYQDSTFGVFGKLKKEVRSPSVVEKDAINFYKNDALISINNVDPMFAKITDTNKRYYERFMDLEHQYFVWFDFEGVTNTIPIIDFHIPWTQLIAQTSIIKTIWNKDIKNYEQIYSQNHVYDPCSYGLDTFIKIVNDLYDENADAYVVFNAGYEHSRLNEIKRYLECYFIAGQISEEKKQEVYFKIDFILSKILDLERFIKIGSLATYKKTMFTISYLKGKSSIKLVEKYITGHKEYDDLKHKIQPYANLAIKNGAMALDKAILRVQGKIGDAEWKKISESLKIYCHNDVMAMIMAAEAFWKIWNNHKYYDNQILEYLGFNKQTN